MRFRAALLAATLFATPALADEPVILRDAITVDGAPAPDPDAPARGNHVRDVVVRHVVRADRGAARRVEQTVLGQEQVAAALRQREELVAVPDGELERERIGARHGRAA